MTTMEFRITTPDTPGTFASIAETLSKANINIEGGLEYSFGGSGYFCFITNNPGKTSSVLEEGGISYTTNDVVVTTLKNAPGALAKLTTALAKAGVNITSFYVAADNKQIFGTDNPETTEEIASNLGVLSEL